MDTEQRLCEKPGGAAAAGGEFESYPREEIKMRGFTQFDTARSCGCPKVLLVDDTESNLFVLKSYMKSAGLAADQV